MEDEADSKWREVTRREFGKRAAMAGVAASLPLAGPGEARSEGGSSTSALNESAVARFYHALKDDQKVGICFPFDDPRRSRVGDDWAVAGPRIQDLSGTQRGLCREIFKSLCSDEGLDRFRRQMEDDSGGFENFHVAVFGAPGTGRAFDWVITGRHLTLRADGNRCGGGVFAGPIFYGHSPHESSGRQENVWSYQGRQADLIFESLDGKERARTLGCKAEPEASGLAVRELDGGQRGLVEKLVEGMLSTFNAGDAEEAREWLRCAGGVDQMRFTYCQNGEIGEGRAWNVWKLQGPGFSWYYHGSPHVHAWINISGS